MSANTLDTTTYNNVAANTVFDAVLDAAKILAWYQNVKAVVDQHATEIDLKFAKTGGIMTGDSDLLILKKTISQLGNLYMRFRNSSNAEMAYFGFGGISNDMDIYNLLSGGNLNLLTTGSGRVHINGLPHIVGSGSPEGVVTAIVGSIFLRLDGAATTTLYVKTSGTGNTGWTAK